MPIKYESALELKETALSVASVLGLNHDFSRITFLRSRGSTSRRTIARCHGLPKVMQIALETKGHYVVEVISERFDRLSEEEKIKTIIHELLHIPKSMGGGFRYHDYVCSKNVDKLYKLYEKSIQ
ncbi:putative metallopeptidase [Candidatus Aenigmatarchaeota archaeon]